MTGGGVIIVGACLAGLATVIALLSVTVCIVRSKRRGRRDSRCRSPGAQHHPITKVELLPLSGSGSDEITADHPLLDPSCDKISSDVTLRQFESEPIRYVVSY